MSELTRHFYLAVGSLVMLAVVAPMLVQLVTVIAPLIGIAGLGLVVARLVWFYTGRY